MKLYHDTANDRYYAARSKSDAFHSFTIRSEEDKPYSWYNPPVLEDIEEVHTPFNPRKCVATAGDFEDYCNDLLDRWLGDLSVETHPQYCRPVREDDCLDDEPAFMYTGRGQDMVERAFSRLSRLAEKHWPDEEIELRTSMFVEY